MGKDDLHKMISLDMYLALLSEEELMRLRCNIQMPANRFPLESWDLSGQSYYERLDAAIIERDRLKLQQLQKKYAWKQDTVKLLNLPYQGLVVTDANLTILWVNPGFTDMTGYPAKYALGKTPKFLQGKNTLEISRAMIRKQLQQGRPFTAVITNYRKNNEEYLCEVKIFPLSAKDGQTTHFIALEQETA